MERRMQFVIFFLISILMCTTSLYAKVIFDDSELDKGIIHITYEGSERSKLKVVIEKEKEKYVYDLNKREVAETFGLQLGNGKYKVSVLKNIEGTSYVLVDAKTVELSLKREQLIYLNAIQNVNWTSDSKAVKKAVELTQKEKSLEKKAKILYGYVVQNYSYDYKKLATLKVGYLPNIEETYETKTGICYDFSSLFAAMLRSQQIPAKLIKGYTPNAEGYHAWNEVYDEATGEWFIIDTTYDLQVIKKKPTIKWIKPVKDYQKVNEY